MSFYIVIEIDMDVNINKFYVPGSTLSSENTGVDEIAF